MHVYKRSRAFKACFWPQILLKNNFWNLHIGAKTIPKNSHMSRPVKTKNKYLIYPTSVALATRRRTIDRAHFALFQFLTISELNF